jgi:AbrB family looped-hinge helix DNA binding protein
LQQRQTRDPAAFEKFRSLRGMVAPPTKLVTNEDVKRLQTKGEAIEQAAGGLDRGVTSLIVLRFNEYNGPIMESAITTKGQATIPKAILEHLHLKPGDRLIFFIHPDGSVVLLPKIPVSQLRGMVKADNRPVTIEEMDEAIAAGAIDAALPGRG